jgi:hypothetical protein
MLPGGLLFFPGPPDMPEADHIVITQAINELIDGTRADPDQGIN